jgi:hypothetical protein
VIIGNVNRSKEAVSYLNSISILDLIVLLKSSRLAQVWDHASLSFYCAHADLRDLVRYKTILSFILEVAMSVDCNRAVEWDGKVLTGLVVVNGVPTKVTADRATIHAYATGFSDALTWEIDRFRSQIFEKLMPFFIRQNS